MTVQTYLEVNNLSKIVINAVEWDGNTETWTPPANSTMLVQAETLALTWVWDNTNKVWLETEVLGAGNIGFTWNGSILITNQSDPTK
jgi:hypothetical protein